MVSREMPASNMTALQVSFDASFTRILKYTPFILNYFFQAVVDVDSERKALDKKAEELASCDDEGKYMSYIYV